MASSLSGDFSGLLKLEAQLRAVSKTGARQIGQRVASEVQHQIDEGFRGGHAPDGTKWAPKSPLSNPGPTLVGASMSATASAKYAGKTITAKIGGKWAQVHQGGKVITPKGAGFLSWVAGGGRVFARKVTIPARPMLPAESVLPGPWDDAITHVAEVEIGKLLK